MNFHQGTIRDVRTNGENDQFTKMLLHFDSGTGTEVVDSSASIHHQFAIGNNTVIQGGYMGAGALQMAGGYIYNIFHRDYEFGAGDWTIDWWEYRYDANDSRPSIARNPDNSPYQAFLLGWSVSGTLQCYFSTSGSAWEGQLSMGPFSANVWTHYAVARKGNTFYTFKNGVLQQSGSLSGALMPNGGYGISIGVYNNGTVNVFNGVMDEVRVSKGVCRWTANFTPLNRRYEPNDDAAANTRLLLHLNGGDNTRSFVDSSHRRRQAATTNGNPVLSTSQSKFGGSSMYLDGASYIAFPDSPYWTPGDDRTFECWVRVSAYPSASNYAIFSQHDTGGAGLWFLYLSATGQPVVLLRHGASTDYYAYGPAAVPLNTWCHVALVRKAGSFTVYTDGVGGTPLATPAPIDFNAPLLIGTWAGNYKFAGWIDEMRVSSVARYSGNFTPPTSPFEPVDTRDPNTLMLLTEGPYDLSSHQQWVWIAGTDRPQGGYPAGSVGAFAFNGTNQYIQWPNHTDYDFRSRNFTIEWWEYRTVAGDNSAVFCRNADSQTYQPLMVGYSSGGGLYCYGSTDNASWNIISALPLGAYTMNQWVHYALVRNGNTFTGYKNGVAQGSQSSGLAIPDSSSAPGFGRWVTDGGASAYFYGGYLDDIRISTIARYTANFTPPTVPHPL